MGAGFDTVGLVALAVRPLDDAQATPIRVGWVNPMIARAFIGHARVERDALGAQVLVVPADPLTWTMAAHSAHEAGAWTGWRDEEYDLRDPATGAVILPLERSAFRAFGLQSTSAQLVAFAPDGRLWLARRAGTKAIDPLLWDTLVGGGVTAGEEPLETMRRECVEEAGLSVELFDAGARREATVELARRVALPGSGWPGVQRETVATWSIDLPADWQPENQDGEVERFELVEPAKALAMVDAGEITFEAGAALRVALAARGA